MGIHICMSIHICTYIKINLEAVGIGEGRSNHRVYPAKSSLCFFLACVF